MRSLCASLSVLKSYKLYFSIFLDFVFITRDNEVKFLCICDLEEEELVGSGLVPRRDNCVEVCSILEVMTGKVDSSSILSDAHLDLRNHTPPTELTAAHLVYKNS